MADPVDVLIIGAGASGGAVAWSLAEDAVMKILVSRARRLDQHPRITQPTGATGKRGNFRSSITVRTAHWPRTGLSNQRHRVADPASPILMVSVAEQSLYAGHYPRASTRRIFG